MRQPAHFRRARISLQTKLIAGLIVIVLTPLLVAAYFVGQLGDVTSTFARNEVRAMRGAVEHADQVYRQLIEARLQIESEVGVGSTFTVILPAFSKAGAAVTEVL